MATINEFKANLIGAGPRANRFKVFIPRLPGGQEFLIRTASLPGQTIETIDAKYQGTTVKLAGDRAWTTWETIVYNDNNFSYNHSSANPPFRPDSPNFSCNCFVLIYYSFISFILSG